MVERKVEVHLLGGQDIPHRGLLGSGAQLVHRALQHLQVHLEADGSDRTVLLCAEQVARASDLQVAQRDLESLAELVQPRHDVEPLVRLFRQRPARVIKEVGISAPS